MPKPKGTPKTGGRKKGTPNKVTASLREWITELIDNERERMQSDLQKLEPKDRLMMLEKLMQYVLPKQHSTRMDFDRLTDTEIDDIVNEITKSL